MKRATVITGAAFVGIAWVISYKVTPHTVALGSPLGLSSPTPTPTQGTPAPPSPTPSASPKVSGSFTGQVESNRYGDVQVKVIITDGKITDVQALQLPTDRAESAYISSQVGPWLHDEVIQAQSAKIDIISGATYTSESYAQSVETALQQAHMG